MDPTQRSTLPPDVEQRVQQVQALTGEARAEALRQVYRDFPEHGAALAARLAPEHSQVVTGSRADPPVGDRLRRLAERGDAAAARYELHGEIARGGMGAILRAFDQDLGRTLAMKVILGEDGEQGGTGPGARPIDSQVLERFVEEAQITGQLDHPGVVPVHELGLDAKGRVYFTMRLVKGITAQDVFTLARSGEQGWTLTRALEVLLKVCDTLAYAHSKGVVHRDLKPSNVMVGKYGEVYVMDWGLAKVLGQEETRDLRIRPPETTSMSRVRTDRSKEHESDPDTALRTMDGAIVGTPCYMPPEQAHGRIEDVGVRSDVYAAGAMLYTLLAGTQPYIDPGSPTTPYMVLEWVRRGPPKPIQQLDRAAPVELVAICEHAMARDVSARYPGMGELADDLRAFLENRVVRAYRTGARAELALWVRRNRGMAFGLLAAMLAIVVGGAGALVYARQADAARQEALRAKSSAEVLRAEAEAAQGRAEKALEDLREEQRRKEELEEDLKRQRQRALWKEERDRGARLQDDEEQRRQQELDQAQQQRLARLRNGEAELRLLAGMLPAASPEAADGGVPPLLGPLLDQLAAQVAGEGTGDAWRGWARGRCLLHAGRADAAAPLLRAALARDGEQKAESDALLEGTLHLALAEACMASGRTSEALASFALAIDRLGGVDADSAMLAARECAWIVARDAANSRGRSDLGPLCDWLDGHRIPDVPTRTGARAAEKDPAPPRLRGLRGVVRTEQGQLAEGAADLGALAEDDATWLPMLAMNQRLRGQPGDALRSAREARSGTVDALLWHESVVEEARVCRAVHRPQAALDVLAQPCPELARPDLLPLLRAELLELEAQCQADLARWDAAQASLEAALALVPAARASTRTRLSTWRSDLLLQLGRADEAIEAVAGLPAAAIGEPIDLPSATLLRVAAAAERGARTGLADACLAKAADDGGRDAAEASLLRMQLLHDRGRSAEAAQLVDSVRASLPRPDDAWYEVRAHIGIAETLAAVGGPALPQLDSGAHSFDAWLRAYSRFQAECTSPTQLASMASLGQRAIATLIRIAPQLGAADTDAAWRVLETFRALPSRITLTRPADLPASVERDRLCAAWRRLTALADAGDPARVAERRRLTLALTRLRSALDEQEQQLRDHRPAWCSVALPRVAALPDVEQVLPADTALVVYDCAGGGAIAFVATHTGAALVPLPLATEAGQQLKLIADAAKTERRPVLDRLGAMLVDPVFASLAQGPPVHTLLLAPAPDLCSLPFELCTAGGSEPLLAHHDVAYVPSGTACYDQLRQRRRARLAPGSGGIALVQPADRAAGAGWIAAALRGVLGEGDDTTLLRALAAPEPEEVHSPTLDLFVGRGATAVPGAARARRAIVLAVDLECAEGALHHSSLQCADGGLSRQDLRDLQSKADFALVCNGAGGIDPAMESQAMLGFALGFWSGGTPAVITAGRAVDASAGAEPVRAFAAARRSGSDGIAAWCDAWRKELAARSSRMDSDVRLWCVKQ
ncbi:MAG TPA: protein kinase [Planctomycetota bacterium]|nr:protein kinase [Planctomycetota bacterium]